jgi:hypothetical protein
MLQLTLGRIVATGDTFAQLVLCLCSQAMAYGESSEHKAEKHESERELAHGSEL